MATRTSCSSVRRGWCEWTSPVATVSTPRCSARSRRRCEAAHVSALERALELDVEALAAERAGEPSGSVRIEEPETAPCAAREADEPLAQLGDEILRHGGRQRLPILATHSPGAGVRSGEQKTEVGVPAARLHQQRDVRAAVEGDLGTRDRPHAEERRCVRELERAVDAVVVGERERLVPELGGPRGELLRLRCAVEEAEGRVAVQLDVVGH